MIESTFYLPVRAVAVIDCREITRALQEDRADPHAVAEWNS